MDQETTTDVVDQSIEAAPEATAEETQPQLDQSTAAESEQTQTQTDANSIDHETTELQEWAAKAGVPLDDPLKLAKMVRDSQKKVHAETKKRSELEAKLTSSAPTQDTGNEILNEILANQQKLTSKSEVTDFYLNNPEARDLDDAMAEYFNEIKESNPTLAQGLMNDLPTLYTLTKARQGGASTEDVADEARRQEREAIARSQRAAVPTAAASTNSESDALTPANIDDKVALMTPEEYKRRLPEINRVLQG